MAQVSTGFRGAQEAERVSRDRDQKLLTQLHQDERRLPHKHPSDGHLAWNQRDGDILSVVSGFNDYLSQTPGYQMLDWDLIKAITLVETGPDIKQWDVQPMQSANPGDPGLADMNSKPTREDLIIPPALRSAVNSPNLGAFNNIAAGVAYLLFRAAHFGTKTVLLGQPYTVTAEKNNSLYRIARRNASTEAIIRSLNAQVDFHRLQPGTKVIVQKTEIQTVITGWDPIDVGGVAARYNANGRGTYGPELAYAYDLIKHDKLLHPPYY